eukprot:9220279-Ditylum_brightwellii.AAC.1
MFAFQYFALNIKTMILVLCFMEGTLVFYFLERNRAIVFIFCLTIVSHNKISPVASTDNLINV